MVEKKNKKIKKKASLKSIPSLRLCKRVIINRSKPKNICENSLSSKKRHGYSCIQITDLKITELGFISINQN